MTLIPNYETANPTLTCAGQSVTSGKTMFAQKIFKTENPCKKLICANFCAPCQVPIDDKNEILKISIVKHNQNKGIIN